MLRFYPFIQTRELGRIRKEKRNWAVQPLGHPGGVEAKGICQLSLPKAHLFKPSALRNGRIWNRIGDSGLGCLLNMPECGVEGWPEQGPGYTRLRQQRIPALHPGTGRQSFQGILLTQDKGSSRSCTTLIQEKN